MYRIYHAPNTRGIRPIWLCEELNVTYEVTHIDFSPAYRATPEWRALSPVGKVPILVDGDLTIFEGLREYPARVKCATLAWQSASAAIQERTDPVTTE